MTSFALRCVALATMIADHVGYDLFSGSVWFRAVGRISFPLYCFLLAQGFRHTHSVPKYAARLALFALISEVPYNMLFHGKYLMPAAHNVFFSLLLALAAMAAWKRFMPDRAVWAALCVLTACAAAYLLKTDYSFWGILLSLGFYWADRNELKTVLALVVTFAVYQSFRYAMRLTSTSWMLTQLYCLLSLAPILLYNGKPGYRGGKWAFYLLYPAHLLVLTWI